MGSNVLVKVAAGILAVIAVILIIAKVGGGDDDVVEDVPLVGGQEINAETQAALGIEGDTPEDTVKTLISQVREMKEAQRKSDLENAELREANERLQNMENNLEQKLTAQLQSKTSELRTDSANQLANTRLEVQGLLDRFRANNVNNTGIGGVNAAGGPPTLSLTQPGATVDSEGTVWVPPLGVATEGQGGSLLSGRGLSSLPFDSNGGPADLTRTQNQGLSGNLEAPEVPAYTIAKNSTLVGATAFTALVGRVPVGENVVDPYSFKVIIGKDNLIANGKKVPELAYAVVSGKAIGDWTLSCVSGQVFSITFVLCVVGLSIAAWFVPASTVGWLALASVVLSLLVGAGAAALLPVDPVAVAKRYDDAVGTKDLLSSSLELDAASQANEPLGGAFVAAVREDAARATGQKTGAELYPSKVPAELKWAVVPALVCLLGMWFTRELPKPPPPPKNEKLVAAIEDGARWLEKLLDKYSGMNVSLPGVDEQLLKSAENMLQELREEDFDKRRTLSSLAKLASQLDTKRRELEARRVELQKRASKLARGQDAKQARQDMDAGRYGEAARKIKKKLAELEEELKKKLSQKAAKVEIEKLKKRIADLKELLAQLEELDSLSRGIGELAETLENLERFEGRLGELGEFDGDVFEEAQFGRLQRPNQNFQQQEEGQERRPLLVPSNESGEGHAKKILGRAKRSLSERKEVDTPLRESKGKSTYGQVKTANDRSKSRTEFDETFLAEKRAADEVIYRQNIPAGYRSYIRRYFDAMQPDDPVAGDPKGNK